MKDIFCNPINDNDRNESKLRIVSFMKGEENMKKMFPKAYEALYSPHIKTRSLAADNNVKPCRMRIIHVAYTDSLHNKLLVCVQADSDKKEGYDILMLSAINKKTGEVLAENTRLDFMDSDNLIDVVCPLKDLNSYKDIVIKASLNKIGNEHASYYTEELTLEEFNIDVVISYEKIEAPKLTVGGKDYIYISYYQHSSPSQYDYIFGDALQTGNLYIPSEGSFVVEKVNLQSVTGTLSASPVGHGKSEEHKNRKTSDIRLIDMKTVYWNIDTDWNTSYKDILLQTVSEVIYTLEIFCQIDQEVPPFSYIVTNSPNVRLAERIKRPIEKIRIYKDCFVAGTQITLQDGTKKAVESLQIGETVACGDETNTNIAEISKTVRKETLCFIELTNGMHLQATTGHMVMTAEGLKILQILSETDQIKTENGFSRIRQIQQIPEQEQEIFVVVLKNGRTLMANGIQTSDSAPILTEEEKRINQRCMIPEAWRQDYDSWMELKQQV